MMYFKKHIMLLNRFIKINWKNGIEYMNDFAIIVLNFFLITGLTILFWNAVLRDTGYIGIWSFKELIILGIFGSTAWALCDTLAGVWQLPEKILSGQLDKYLNKPISPLFGIVAESMHLDEALKGIISFIVFITFVCWKYDYDITVKSTIISIICLSIGVIIICLIRIFFSLLTFWVGKSNILNRLIHFEDFNLERYPINIYSKNLQKIFTWILPVGFMATYPTMIFLNKINNCVGIIVYEIAVLFIWLFIVLITWKAGIKRYESNGG